MFRDRSCDRFARPIWFVATFSKGDRGPARLTAQRVTGIFILREVFGYAHISTELPYIW